MNTDKTEIKVLVYLTSGQKETHRRLSAFIGAYLRSSAVKLFF
jgi:hypothetical protein